jgi:hypothetical protein
MYEQFEKYYQIANKLKESADRLWSSVSFIHVIEIVNSEVYLQDLSRKCYALQKIEMDTSREVSRKVEEYSDDEYEGELEKIDNALYELFRNISDKLSAIDDTIETLKKIEEKSEEDNYLELFRDSKFFKLSESNEFIRLTRFKK